MDIAQEQARVTNMASEFLPAADAALLGSLVRPAVSLRRGANGAGGAGGARSHLGGSPRLAVDAQWPRWQGRALSLLAVVDLGDQSRLDTGLALPEDGFLNVFYEVDEQPWGFDPAHRGAWRLRYCPAGAVAPSPLEAPPGATTFGHVGLQAVQISSVPSWNELVLQALFERLPHEASALFDRLDNARPENVGHQVGGWPALIQNPVQLESQMAANGLNVGDGSAFDDLRFPQLEAEADVWRLLLQIDSDDQAGWMWGDGGCLYFMLREADLANQVWDQTWMVLQCS